MSNQTYIRPTQEFSKPDLSHCPIPQQASQRSTFHIQILQGSSEFGPKATVDKILSFDVV